MALFGAGIGPVALAWGLQHTSGTSASLMLALEALFTAVLARLLYREVMDRRVWTAMLLLLAGGIALVLDRGLTGGMQGLGLIAVLGATAAWGVDNTLSRPLAERDPGQVVFGKSLLGATIITTLAIVSGEPQCRHGPRRRADARGRGAASGGIAWPRTRPRRARARTCALA